MTNGDGFVARISGSGDLLWASYLGGRTGSPDFPTPGGFDTTHNGGRDDCFIVRIDPLGQIAWGTYMGGSAWDHVTNVDVDDAGNALVGGITYSADFPAFGGFDSDYNGGAYDGFVAKITASGDLAWSSFLGGSGDELAMAGSSGVDDAGNVLISGPTSSSDFPTPWGI